MNLAEGRYGKDDMLYKTVKALYEVNQEIKDTGVVTKENRSKARDLRDTLTIFHWWEIEIAYEKLVKDMTDVNT